MALKREDIHYDPQVDKLVTCLMIKLCDGNGMMLKAKAELYLGIMNAIEPLVDAKIAEFTERYGEEVVKFAHNNIGEEDLRDISPSIKFIDSKEINRRLLEKAFPQDVAGRED